MHNLSAEVWSERWVENPDYQLVCGEEFVQHKLPFDRSSMTRWRQRMGEEPPSCKSALQPRRAAKPAGFAKVIVDTTVQPKAFPTDAKRMHGWHGSPRSTASPGIRLMRGIRAHQAATLRACPAVQAGRRAPKTLKTHLGRGDIGRKIAGNDRLKEGFAKELMLARRVHAENNNLRPLKGAPAEAGLRGFSLPAPEVMHRQGQGPSAL